MFRKQFIYEKFNINIKGNRANWIECKIECKIEDYVEDYVEDYIEDNINFISCSESLLYLDYHLQFYKFYVLYFQLIHTHHTPLLFG